MTSIRHLRAAARAAVRPWVRLGRIVAVHGGNDYDVQIPGHIDAYGVEIPMQHVRSLSANHYVVGEEVYVGHLNHNRPREGALWVILDSGAAQSKTKPLPKLKLWWPRQRATLLRDGSALKNESEDLTFMHPDTLHLWQVTSDESLLIRADSQYVYQIGKRAGSRAIVAWALKTPEFDELGLPKPYDPALVVNVQVNHAWLDALLGRIWTLRTSPQVLEVWNNDFTATSARTGSEFNALCEAVRTSNSRLVVVSSVSAGTWNWVVIDYPSMSTSSSFQTSWPSWSTYDRMPASLPNQSYPVFGWDDYDSPYDDIGIDFNLLVGGNCIVLPNVDQAWQDYVSTYRGDMSSREVTDEANFAHIFSRGQLKVISDSGAVVWQKNYNAGSDIFTDGLGARGNSTTASDNQQYSYAGVSPTIIAGNTLISHYSMQSFITHSIKYPIVDMGVYGEIDKLPTNDPHAFNNTDWWNQAPAPPWAWKSAYIDVKISEYMDLYEPSVSAPVLRDFQTAYEEGLVAHDINTGVKVAQFTQPFAMYGTTTLDRVLLTKDTGAPNTFGHSGGRVEPLDYTIRTPERRTGVDSAGNQTLREVLNLDDTERVILYFAKEQYSGTSWPGWDFTYIYKFDGSLYGFDSRYDPTPRLDGTLVMPPYWEDQADEFTVIQYPFGNQGATSPLMGVGLRGYNIANPSASTFYKAHARYCAFFTGTRIDWYEPTIPFVNYDDPEGNFSHHTHSVEYHAWVIKLEWYGCAVPDPRRGWSAHNMVYDGGQYVYALPRRTRSGITPTKYGTGGPIRSSLNKTCTIGMFDASTLSLTSTIALPTKPDGSVYVSTTLHATPAGFAYRDEQGNSILWVFFEGMVLRYVNGYLSGSKTVPGASAWTSAQILYADGAVWICGGGTGSSLYKLEPVQGV